MSRLRSIIIPIALVVVFVAIVMTTGCSPH
jgi:hypothetical protein